MFTIHCASVTTLRPAAATGDKPTLNIQLPLVTSFYGNPIVISYCRVHVHVIVIIISISPVNES